jgi:hypothetical protein
MQPVPVPRPMEAPPLAPRFPLGLVVVAVALVGLFGGVPVALAEYEALLEVRAIDDQSVTSNTVVDVAPANGKSVCVSNRSATCIRMGAPSTNEAFAPTSTRGARIGSGCECGMVHCFDAKRFGLISESGTVSNIAVWYAGP